MAAFLLWWVMPHSRPRLADTTPKHPSQQILSVESIAYFTGSTGKRRLSKALANGSTYPSTTAQEEVCCLWCGGLAQAVPLCPRSHRHLWAPAQGSGQGNLQCWPPSSDEPASPRRSKSNAMAWVGRISAAISACWSNGALLRTRQPLHTANTSQFQFWI